MTVDTRLATYGTLAPGQVNERVLAQLEGRWLRGVVRGRLIEAGWGAEHGCPGMRPDANGDEIEVHLFESAELPQHWRRLDAFEGPGYERIPILVLTDEGEIEASIYALKP
ncbi:MAG: gamma-glutamylcyclotransferase family protein [Pseudomonadota bacterium]